MNKKIYTSIIVLVLLSYVFINTNDIFTRIIVIPFIMYTFNLLCKSICIIINKPLLADIFNKLLVISFSLYYFSFLIYYDYICIINKDYITILFTILPWIGGIYIVYKKLFKK